MNVTSLVLLGYWINTTQVLQIDLSPPRKEKLIGLLETAVTVPESTLQFRAQICGGIQSGELADTGTIINPLSPL